MSRSVILTSFIPELARDQDGLSVSKFLVNQTPSSVPTMTSFSKSGFCRIALTGISGKFPSFSCQVSPPSSE